MHVRNKWLVGLLVGAAIVGSTGCAGRKAGTSSSKTYTVVQQAKGWSAARAYCDGLGQHLATIRDQADQDEADRLGAGVPLLTTYWIGLNDLAQQGVWAWDSGEPVAYENWERGQPDDSLGVEHCAVMRFLDGSASGWNDESCSVPHYFMCEAE